MTEVTSQALRQWREAKGWDVPRMARELRKAARDTGEDVAAHHGLVKMIPQWERGARVPRERYRLLYLKVFGDIAADLSPGVAIGTEYAMRLAAVTYVSGERDTGVRPEDTRTLAEAAGGQWRIVPGAGHLGAIKIAGAEVLALALDTFRRAEEAR